MKLKLRVSSPGGSASVSEHDGPVVTIGRDPDATLTFDGAESDVVSWEHAQIELKENAAFVSDSNSTNGTYLNGQKVEHRKLLKLGDKITLGVEGPEIAILEFAAGPSGIPPGAAATADHSEPKPPSAARSVIPTQPEGVERPSWQWASPPVIAASAAAVVVLILAGILIVSLTGSDDEQEVASASAAAMAEPDDDANLTSVPEAKSQPDVEPKPAYDPITQRTHKPQSPKLTPDQLKQRFRGKVVWIGFRSEDSTFPFCNGWALQESVVVTTATNVDHLEQAQRAGSTIVVSSEPSGTDVIDVVNMQVHPSFERNDTVSQSSVTFNLGTLTLSKRLPSGCGLPQENTAPVLSGANVTIVGFSLPAPGETLVALDAQHAPTLFALTARARGDGRTQPYNLDVESTVPFGLSGAPVVSADGVVVAVFATRGQEISGIPVQYVKGLIR
ncbi:MAG: FHA domain-containing protein [Planctomycetes bacterium]|nr:FHA domain-containing protein [Planctomycetota bacterium]